MGNMPPRVWLSLGPVECRLLSPSPPWRCPRSHWLSRSSETLGVGLPLPHCAQHLQRGWRGAGALYKRGWGMSKSSANAYLPATPTSALCHSLCKCTHRHLFPPVPSGVACLWHFCCSCVQAHVTVHCPQSTFKITSWSCACPPGPTHSQMQGVCRGPVGTTQTHWLGTLGFPKCTESSGCVRDKSHSLS